MSPLSRIFRTKATRQNQSQVPNVKFRVLIIGRANAGKTSILQRVCDTTESPKIYRVDQEGQRSEVQLEPTTERGLHHINDEIIFERHDGYIFHDTRGFEAGSEDELKIVQEFITRRSHETRLKDRLHVIWFCIPMDNDRPSLDLKHFNDICPDKNVPVIALFTKYDQFKRNIKIKFKDHPEAQIEAEVKGGFEQHYLAGLSGLPPYICLERMHKADQQCTNLIKLTANSLSGNVVALMLVAVQKDNLELSIYRAIYWITNEPGGIQNTDIVLQQCLYAFPWIWYPVNDPEFQQRKYRDGRYLQLLLKLRKEQRKDQEYQYKYKHQYQPDLLSQPDYRPDYRQPDLLDRKFNTIISKLKSILSNWSHLSWNQEMHHTMIVTIIFLDFTCRFCASSPNSTHAKVLEDAFSHYKQSSTHNEVKRQFPGSSDQYSVLQFEEFILQHRL